MAIQSRTDQCKILWYQWNFDIQDDSSAFDLVSSASLFSSGSLAQAEQFDISDHIIDCTFTKSMGEGSGSFSLILGNSLDWRRYMKSGEWMTIYMASDGTLPTPSSRMDQATSANKNKFLPVPGITIPGIKENANKPNLPKANVDLKSVKNKLRSICFIERVARRMSVSSSGAVDITYSITGKDFGVCLEDTDLWFNFFYFEKSVFEVISKTNIGVGARKLGALMSTFFDAFFRPDSIFKGLPAPNNISENLKQWLMPDVMITDLGLSVNGTSYFGNIEGLKEFHETAFENNMADPLAGLQGTAWEKLKDMSQPEFHELFTEVEDDGTPRIIFRPIPWALNKDKYPNIGKNIPLYADLAQPAPGVLSGDISVASLSSATQAATSFFSDPVASASAVVDTQNFRKVNNFQINSSDVFAFDLGPDFHSRYNHFYIDGVSQASPQFSMLHALGVQKKITTNFPFKNDPSIKRHGLRRRHFKVKSFVTSENSISEGPLKDTPFLQFVLECNEVQKDYWGQAEDYESGFFMIAGKNETKLGKVLVTDATVDGAQSMAFYVEQYTDSFSVDEKGIGSWSQSVGVTRGIELADLSNRSGTKDRLPIAKVGNLVPKGRAQS